MKMKLLLLLAVIFCVGTEAQIQLPDNDPFASRMVARIHHVDPVRASLLSNGVFINPRSILTVASAIHGLNMTQIRIEFGNTNLVGSRSVVPESVIVHPNFNINNLLENNLAVLRLSPAGVNDTTPLVDNADIGRLIRSHHFCSMLGYGELFSSTWLGREPMQMIPAQIEQDSTSCNHLFRGDFTCSFGRDNIFAMCGGFIGSPIVCDGQRVAGLVVQDRFCGARPTAYITDLERHGEWIFRVSGGGKAIVSLLMLFVGILVSKIV